MRILALLAAASVAAAVAAAVESLPWDSSVPSAPALGVAQPPIALTIHAQRNLDFEADVAVALRVAEHRMQGELCLSLTTAPLALTPQTCPEAAKGERPLIIVALLREGVFHRIYASHATSMDRPLPLGSISKAVVAVPLLAYANARSHEDWCEQAYQGITNADGSTGTADCQLAQPVPAIRAVAKSNNLAMIWRLRQIPEDTARRGLASAGILVSPTRSPAAAAALGLELSPRQVLECLNALGSGRAARAALIAQPASTASPLGRWCADSVARSARRALIQALLSAPGDSGGTAAFAKSLLPSAGPVLLKTGTPTNADRMDTGKVLAGTFQTRDARYTFLIALLSPRPSVPLGRRLRTQDLAPLVSVVAAHVGANFPTAPAAPDLQGAMR